MKEQKKKKEEQTKTNDNSKISVANGSNEPCRGLAIPSISFYMDKGGTPRGGGMYI